MILLRKASRYAIRALMSAIETGSFPRFSTKDVCLHAGIPEPFTRKSLQEMTKAGILQGIPGPGGGYIVVRDPSEVSLLDIILAVDGQNAFAECPMGLRCQSQAEGEESFSCKGCTLPDPKCGLSHICPMHDLWKETRQLVIPYLEKTALQDISNNLRRASTTI